MTHCTNPTRITPVMVTPGTATLLLSLDLGFLRFFPLPRFPPVMVHLMHLPFLLHASPCSFVFFYLYSWTYHPCSHFKFFCSRLYFLYVLIILVPWCELLLQPIPLSRLLPVLVMLVPILEQICSCNALVFPPLARPCSATTLLPYLASHPPCCVACSIPLLLLSYFQE